jgi:hypothetical protein
MPFPSNGVTRIQRLIGEKSNYKEAAQIFFDNKCNHLATTRFYEVRGLHFCSGVNPYFRLLLILIILVIIFQIIFNFDPLQKIVS